MLRKKAALPISGDHFFTNAAILDVLFRLYLRVGQLALAAQLKLLDQVERSAVVSDWT